MLKMSRIISFNQFKKDYIKEYKPTSDIIRVLDDCEMDEIIEELYDASNYEMDYENKTIIIY
jgi:hypothetical protein